MSFVSTLNKLMEINKTSNIALGKEVGVSDAAVAKWRKGEASPSLDNAMLIAKYYDVSLDELVGNKLSLGGHYRIPILGDVSAGRMALSSLFTGEYLTVDDDDLDGYSREECYALEVNGTSMEPEFPDGFYIIVHQQKFCSEGDYVIVLDETTGDNTFKKFTRKDDRIELLPLNPVYKKLVYKKQDINRLIIQGVVINKIIPV